MQDFIVIGGGVAGTSAGAHLSELGRVTVLERETALAYHASGRSAALFEENYGKPSTIALNRASRAHHEAMGVLSPRGFMLVAKADEKDGFEADLAMMQLDQITVDEAKAHWPNLSDDVTMAGYHADCWDIDTDLLVQTFAKRVRANGGQVITGAGVTAIARTDDGWGVTAGGQVYQARHLVNAAGAWVDGVAEMAGIAPLGFTPLRRSMARISQPDGIDLTRAPILFGPGEKWYAKPDAGALIVSPADADLMEPHDAWADDMVLAEGLARYEEYVSTPVTRMIANWAGLRTFAPDGNLVIGPSAQDAAFIWCAGQGGYGVQSSPGYGRFLADVIAGRPPEIAPDMAALLAPARFG